MSKPRLPGTVLPARSTLDQHPEHLQALGMLSIEIANLEIMLAELLAGFLHIARYVGHVVYLTPQTAIGRLKILENVIEDSVEDKTETKKRLDKIISKARFLILKRHEYIHGAWGISTDNKKFVVRRDIPFRSNKKPTVVPLKEITDFIHNIRELTEIVKSETNTVFESWPAYTWQETLRGAPFRDHSLIPVPPASSLEE